MFSSNCRLPRYRISAAALLFAAIAGSTNCSRAQESRLDQTKEGRLDGDVFIVTQGAANVKLGLVEVGVLRLEDATSSIAQTMVTEGREMAKLQSQLDAARKALSSAGARHRKEAKTLDDHQINPSAEEFERAEDAESLASKEVASARLALAALERQAQNWNSAPLYFESLPPPIASAKTDVDGKFSIMLKSKAAVAVAAHATRMVGDKVENYYWIVSVSLNGQLSKRIFLSNDNLVTSGSKDSLVHVGE